MTASHNRRLTGCVLNQMRDGKLNNDKHTRYLKVTINKTKCKNSGLDNHKFNGGTV